MLARRWMLTSRQLPQCLVESLWILRLRPSSSNPPHVPVTWTAKRSASSNARWLARQARDPFTRATKVSALKSRAAFKLLEIDQKHHLFRPGQTVVDLGYAPGSWSQVAISRVRPADSPESGGRVLGIDLIPTQPPKGVSTIQGNFLSSATRERVIEFVRDPLAGRSRAGLSFAQREDDDEEHGEHEEAEEATKAVQGERPQIKEEVRLRDEQEGRVVDVVLSDMGEPWPLINTWVNSVINPYRRMMNTSGNSFKDHAGSIDLCMAALTFAYDTLKTGGSFLCKYYQGNEDKAFEKRLKVMFEKVHRIKPDSSRKESREAYFLALHRKPSVHREKVFEDG